MEKKKTAQSNRERESHTDSPNMLAQTQKIEFFFFLIFLKKNTQNYFEHAMEFVASKVQFPLSLTFSYLLSLLFSIHERYGG